MLLGTWGTDLTHLLLFSCVDADGQSRSGRCVDAWHVAAGKCRF